MDKKISEFIEVYTLEDNTVIPVVQGDPLYNAKISTKNFVLGIISDIRAELGDFDLDDKYLSKTKPDTAQGHITFNDGITSKEAVNFGEYTSGIQFGKGGQINKYGRAELESLTLRGSLETPELIYNRLTVVGDELAVGAGGKIKNVTTINATQGTYRIELKLDEGDTGTFIVHDIIKGIFNHLGIFGVTWAGVTAVEGDNNEFLTVTVRANDSSGEWRNYPPKKFMHISRWGNFSDSHKDRQSVIFLSAKTANITILDGVNSFDGGYVNSQWGKPGSLTDVGSPLQFAPVKPNDSMLYLRTLAVQDLIRIDWKGKPIREIRDRGLWSLETAQSEDYYRITSTLQDEVWHIGVKYRCMFDNTIEEPGTGSAWEVIVDLSEVVPPGEDGKDAVAPKIIDGMWAFWNESLQDWEKSTFSAEGDEGKSPYIDKSTKTWWEWNVSLGKYVDTLINAEGKDGIHGKDAKAPKIIDGNWAFWSDSQQDWIRSTFSAVGDDGNSPYVGANGNWYEWDPNKLPKPGYKDTGIKAEGKDGNDGNDGNDGRGITSLVRYYLISKDKTGITYDTDGWTTIPNNAILTSYFKYLWSYDYVTYSDNTDSKTTPAIIGVYGDKGDAGNVGEVPIPYQHGKWYDFVRYTRTSRSYPIVEYESLYYYLSKETVVTGGRTPKDDWAANDANTLWKLADNFQMLITDALFADFGKLGSFVFKDNVMWSQQGSKPNYTDPGFVPNLEIDGETGKIKARDADIEGDITAKRMFTPFKNLPDSDAIYNPSKDVYEIQTDQNISSSGWDMPSTGNRGCTDYIELPFGLEYIGSRIIIMNSCYPPYTRSVCSAASTVVRVHPDSKAEGVFIGIGGKPVPENHWEHEEPYAIQFIATMVEFICVPRVVRNNDVDTTYPYWIVMNWHESIKEAEWA